MIHNTRYIYDINTRIYIPGIYSGVYITYWVIYIYISIFGYLPVYQVYMWYAIPGIYIWYGVYNIRYIYMNIYCQDIIYFEVYNIIYIIYMHPPRAACERGSMRIPLACCLLLFLLFFDFDLEMVCFILVLFCCGYIMLSPRLRFLLRLVYR